MRTANTHKNMARCAATATLACVLGLGLVAPAYADTASDLAAARTKLEQIGTQTQQIHEELSAQTQELDQTAGEITQKQQEIAEGQAKLSSYVAGEYKTGGLSLLQVLTGDMLNRLFYYGKVSDKQAQTIQEVKDLKQQLTDKQTEQEKNVAATQKKVDELNAQQAEAQSVVNSLDSQLQAELAAEAEANAAVRADTPVHCWVPDPETLARTDYRSKKELTGDVRLVEAGGDCCACCGTHLTRTGEVGLIKIISFAHYKSGMRLAVACGQRAYDAVAGIWADTEAAGRLLSSPVGSLTPALERLQNGEAALKARLAALQNTLAAACAEAAVPGTPAVLWVDGADGDGLRRVAMAITAKTNAPCCTLGPGGQGLAYALAAAPGGDVRETCKALNAAYQGRGGGKPGFCQGSLAEGSFEQVKAFLLKSLLLREKVAEAPTEAG